jgi:hypothetical protein
MKDKVTMTCRASFEDAQRADNAAERVKLKPANLMLIGLEKVLREIETTGGLTIPPPRSRQMLAARAKPDEPRRRHPLFEN